MAEFVTENEFSVLVDETTMDTMSMSTSNKSEPMSYETISTNFSPKNFDDVGKVDQNSSVKANNADNADATESTQPFAALAVQQPAETTDDVKHWIKKTLSGKSFTKRKTSSTKYFGNTCTTDLNESLSPPSNSNERGLKRVNSNNSNSSSKYSINSSSNQSNHKIRSALDLDALLMDTKSTSSTPTTPVMTPTKQQPQQEHISSETPSNPQHHNHSILGTTSAGDGYYSSNSESESCSELDKSTNDIKQWIKKTVPGSTLKRMESVEAHHVIVHSDEDGGPVRRRSWSFRKTPDVTPDKNKVGRHSSGGGGGGGGSRRDSRRLSRGDSDVGLSQGDSDHYHTYTSILPYIPVTVIDSGDENDEGGDEGDEGTGESRVASRQRSSEATGGTVSDINTPSLSSGVIKLPLHNVHDKQPPQQQQQLSALDVAANKKLATTPAKTNIATPPKSIQSYDRSKLRTVEKKEKSESKVEIPVQKVEILPQKVEEKVEIVVEIVPYDELKQRNALKQFDHLTLGALEKHLDDVEFLNYFEVTKAEFYKQPAWKQRDKKKKLGLF